jgi:hypothetical protein
MARGSSCSVRHLLVAACALLALSALTAHVDARYLPTRGQDDRLDRLRELLKDVSILYILFSPHSSFL